MLAWDSQCDAAMVKAIGAGDERTFIELVTRFHASMVGFARGFVHTEAAAEDVVQDTWEAVVKCIDRFEGRSTLKTWIFLILANQSRSRAARDGQSIFTLRGRSAGAAWQPWVDGRALIGISIRGLNFLPARRAG